MDKNSKNVQKRKQKERLVQTIKKGIQKWYTKYNKTFITPA